MAEQFLYRANVSSALQQVRGEGVAQCVYRGRTFDPRGEQGVLQLSLDELLMHVVSPGGTAARVTRTMVGSEHPVPAPGTGAVWVLPGERIGHFHPGTVQSAVVFPESAGARALLPHLSEQ